MAFIRWSKSECNVQEEGRVVERYGGRRASKSRAWSLQTSALTFSIRTITWFINGKYNTIIFLKRG